MAKYMGFCHKCFSFAVWLFVMVWRGLAWSEFVDRLVDKTIMISFGWQTLPFIACSLYLCSKCSSVREKYREITWNHMWSLRINRNKICFSIFLPRISTENHFIFIYWVITITCTQLWSMCTTTASLKIDPIVGLSQIKRRRRRPISYCNNSK